MYSFFLLISLSLFRSLSSSAYSKCQRRITKIDIIFFPPLHFIPSLSYSYLLPPSKSSSRSRSLPRPLISLSFLPTLPLLITISLPPLTFSSTSPSHPFAPSHHALRLLLLLLSCHPLPLSKVPLLITSPSLPTFLLITLSLPPNCLLHIMLSVPPYSLP